MRRIILLLLLIAPLSVELHAQNSNENTKGAVITVIPDTVKLGVIYVDDINTDSGKVEIKVNNNGTKPLIMHTVKGCCGTNIADYTKGPILPGKEGVIKVEFRIEPRPQQISRTVTIESNAVNSRVTVVKILGSVNNRKAKNEISL